MDFRFFEFLQGLQRSVTSLTKKMISLVSRIQSVIEYFQNDKVALTAELAATKEALAVALANDAADAEAIAQAEADAAAAHEAHEAAATKAAELQTLVDADTEEDAAITALLDSVEIPA
jgi:peptidoglycan hydrolase CwlO-like protein